MASDENPGAGDDPDYIASRILASLSSSSSSSLRRNPLTSTSLPRPHSTSHVIQRISESPEQTTSSSLSPAPTGATSSSISPAPSSGVVSLLHLPAEVLSDIAEYLKHPWDKEEWYEPYLDFTCCRDEFEKRMMHDDTAKWQERRRSRAGILRFASVSKSIRKMVLMDLFKRIGFNLCANQHELAVPDLAVASCRELFIHKDSRDHRVDDKHPLSYTDILNRFVNAQEVTISYRLFSNVEAFGDYGKKLEQGLMREANAGDDRRERRRRGENVPFSNPNVEHLTIKAMATGTDDWWEKNGLLQLESLGLMFRQLDLPNVRFLKYRQEDMWGFHCTQFPWFWDRIADAFQGADYPLLEELELELEMDQDAWICDTVLCEVVETLLCAIHPSRILRSISVSLSYNTTFQLETGCPWKSHKQWNRDRTGLMPRGLRREALPDLARLLLMVKTVKEHYPLLETFSMNLGCTFPGDADDNQNLADGTYKCSYLFWTFDYLHNPDRDQEIIDFAPPEESLGEYTSNVHVEKDKLARYTVYEDEIQETLDHAYFASSDASIDSASGGES